MSKIIELEEINSTMIREFYAACEQKKLFKNWHEPNLDPDLAPGTIQICMASFFLNFQDAIDLDALGKASLDKKREDHVEFYRTVFNPPDPETPDFFQLKDAAPIGLWEILRITNEIKNEYKLLFHGRAKKIDVIEILPGSNFDPKDIPMQDIAEQLNLIKVYPYWSYNNLFEDNIITQCWAVREGEHSETKIHDFIKKNQCERKAIRACTGDDRDQLNNVLGYVIKNKGQINNPEIKKQFDGAELQQLISLAEKIHKLDAIATEFTQEVAKKKQALPEID